MAGTDGHGEQAIVDGDAVLRGRPMDWVVEPLRWLGADIAYLGEPGRLPVLVRAGITHSATIDLAVGSAQARSTVLTACVTAGIPVRIRRPVRSRDHSERLFGAMGARLVEDDEAVEYLGGPITALPVIEIPGDPSLAAYPAAAELLTPSPEGLRIRGVCLNLTRIGFFEVLRRAGARISYQDSHLQAGEPVGTVIVEGGLAGVRPLRVSDSFTLHSLIDEVPLLAAIASRIPGESVVECAQELSFKETDRLVTTTRMLRAFGAVLRYTDSSLHVRGAASLRSGITDSFGDHRLSMAAATLATALPGATTVLAGTCHDTSYPQFSTAMRALGYTIAQSGVPGPELPKLSRSAN